MSARLTGQSVLITGGASGLGLAIVARFVREGAKVTVLDRSAERLSDLRQQYGEDVCTVTGDVTQLDDNQRAVNQAIKAFGQLDCAIGNAGIWDFMQRLVDFDNSAIDQAFDEVFHVNVKGCLLLAKAAAPALVRSNGSLLFTLSNAAFHSCGGGALYTASKHALVGLIKQLAFELAPSVRVNGIAPGGIDTPLSGPAALGADQASLSDSNLLAGLADRLPIGTAPSADEYTGAYVFFATRGDTVPATGSILNYDGGIGVRGFGSAAGGADLAQRFSQSTE